MKERGRHVGYLLYIRPLCIEKKSDSFPTAKITRKNTNTAPDNQENYVDCVNK